MIILVAISIFAISLIAITTMKEFEIEDSLGFIISRTKALMQNYFNYQIKLNNIDATAEQWGLLNIINSNPGLTQSKLALLSLKDKTNITRMLDVLERGKRIKRENDKNDRRTYRIFITEAGKELIKKLIPIAQNVNNKSSESMNKKELDTLIKLLRQLNSNLAEN